MSFWRQRSLDAVVLLLEADGAAPWFASEVCCRARAATPVRGRPRSRDAARRERAEGLEIETAGREILLVEAVPVHATELHDALAIIRERDPSPVGRELGRGAGAAARRRGVAGFRKPGTSGAAGPRRAAAAGRVHPGVGATVVLI